MAMNVFAGLSIVSVGLIALGLYVWTPLIVTRLSIVAVHPWRFGSIALSELSSIRFHYQAVAGFQCVWEFTSRSGKVILVSHMRIDNGLLAKLEQRLPNFSREEFHRVFYAGDVEDTLDVWKAPSIDRS